MGMVPPHSHSEDFIAPVEYDLAADLYTPTAFSAVNPYRELTGRNCNVTKCLSLLKCCQNRLMHYRSVKVMSFPSLLIDELASGALLHTYAPQMIARDW
ncbi:unnamed protein product [Hymenolepis diminuta]|uniref:Uncharacterized protein n=1 Tax=Hymenolepis diminuta TaxID=6216 RepID=A0A3P6ZHF5_HYMDI|nr:unnamed protein product [Hymenolepis diminuta]